MAHEKLGVQRMLRYGILGGTFDPPHLGHLVLAQEAHTQFSLDKVWFVPAGQPPHKQEVTHTPAPERHKLVELAIAGDERFGLSTVELRRAGPSYTVDTLRQLRSTWGPDTWVCLVLGWDMVSYLPSWHDPSGVLEQVDQIAAACRPGYQTSDEELVQLGIDLPNFNRKVTIFTVPQLDISATVLRERVADGRPLRYLVPDAVRHYIEEHDLYRPADLG
ncbi:MAG: nicotinate-nucleotide adenylyltransferase [Ktedonobacterales bacterium]